MRKVRHFVFPWTHNTVTSDRHAYYVCFINSRQKNRSSLQSLQRYISMAKIPFLLTDTHIYEVCYITIPITMSLSSSSITHCCYINNSNKGGISHNKNNKIMIIFLYYIYNMSISWYLNIIIGCQWGLASLHIYRQ